MKKMLNLILIALAIGVLQSAFFLESDANVGGFLFSYITLASVLTALAVKSFYHRVKSIFLASSAAFVVGAVLYNMAGLLFDAHHLPRLLEALMVLGGATGIVLGLVQIKVGVSASRA